MASADLPIRQRILCGIDGGECSTKAAGIAVAFARKLDAELIFAMVNPRIAGRAAILYAWPRAHVAAILDRAVRQAVWRGVPAVKAETWCAESVADALADYADRSEADYIVIGGGQRWGWRRLFDDSVARVLPEKANCPVLIVNHLRADAAKGRGDGLRRLLFGMAPGPVAPLRLPGTSYIHTPH
ncbi:MAG TPA: universal stress protein [Dongiaceae bacterium]|nr:universal stress protein [Dongiaceae bacterium]